AWGAARAAEIAPAFLFPRARGLTEGVPQTRKPLNSGNSALKVCEDRIVEQCFHFGIAGWINSRSPQPCDKVGEHRSNGVQVALRPPLPILLCRPLQIG